LLGSVIFLGQTQSILRLFGFFKKYTESCLQKKNEKEIFCSFFCTIFLDYFLKI
jgi:hypothetical protein